MAQHNELGKEGELLARQFLKEKGFRIVETNFRYEKDEIDIIAIDNNELVFVEVKTRSNEHFGEPEEAVGLRKESFLVRAAEAYLQMHSEYAGIRFDIVAVILSKNKRKIKHIKDAFYPEQEN